MLKRRNLLAAPVALMALKAARAFAQSTPATGNTGMRYRKLGETDLNVSVLGLGCNNFGGTKAGGWPMELERSRAVIDAALDVGVNFFDTADIYGDAMGGSEEHLGKVLKDRRKQVILATKWGSTWGPGQAYANERVGTRAFIRRAVEASLRRLQTDYIDLYQYHQLDPQTPFKETLAALDELKREGKVRHIGASNFTAAQMVEADQVARVQGMPRFKSIQNQYSLLETEAEADVLPVCARLNIAFIPWFPLAGGLLTGKYRRNQPAPADARLSGKPIPDDTYDRIEALEKFATQRGKTLLDLAFAGLAAHPQIASVIAGATKPEQIRANAASITWELSAADAAELRKLTAKT